MLLFCLYLVLILQLLFFDSNSSFQSNADSGDSRSLLNHRKLPEETVTTPKISTEGVWKDYPCTVLFSRFPSLLPSSIFFLFPSVLCVYLFAVISLPITIRPAFLFLFLYALAISLVTIFPLSHQVIDNEDGSFDLKYKMEILGVHKCRILYDSQLIPGSLFTLVTLSGSALVSVFSFSCRL